MSADDQRQGADLDTWTEAVWSSDLVPFRRMVALVYAEVAAQVGQPVAVPTSQGMGMAKVSRNTWLRARRDLVRAGWLDQVDDPGAGVSPRCYLAVPPAAQAERLTVDQRQDAARSVGLLLVQVDEGQVDASTVQRAYLAGVQDGLRA